jgi:GrpB-like predicted nucleotidyltransferase (UPF0157 family)
MRTIELVPYNPQWPADYLDLSRNLKIRLWREIIGIEHFGSTSVPGLAAKPILDIMLIIPDTENAFRNIKTALGKIGYSHEGDLGITGREAFKNRDKYVPYDMSGREWPEHYLYGCRNHASVLVDFLAFREYLRKHPKDVEEYSRVKMQAAELYPLDINGYMVYKKECVENILQKTEPEKRMVRAYLETLDKSQ